MTPTFVLAGRTAAMMTLLVTMQFTPRGACACPPRGGNTVYYPRTATAVPVAKATAPTQPVVEIVNQARQALKQRNFAAALQLAEQALQRMPQNSELLQLKSLVLMMKGDFLPAAVAAHTGLSLGVSFNRATISSLVPDETEYVRQFQVLDRQAKDAPHNPDLQFLLAYHLLASGNVTEGRAALLAARDRLPSDKLIPVLLSQLPAPPASIDAAPANVATAAHPVVEK